MTQIWVYMLRCRDGSYTGHTDDLEKRPWEHNEGLAADWTRRLHTIVGPPESFVPSEVEARPPEVGEE